MVNMSHVVFENQSEVSPVHSKHKHLAAVMPIVFWVFLLVETIITILGNSILCWLFLGNKKLRTRQNYFIVSLSISDLLVGLSIVPCEYCRFVREQDEKNCPIFCGSIISFNMMASIINLVLISTDRFLSVKKPYLYMKIFTKRRAIWLIVYSWIATIVLSTTPILWTDENLIDSTTGTTINIIYSKTLCSLTLLAGMLLAYFYYEIVQTIRTKTRQSKCASSFPAGIWVCILSSIVFMSSWLPYCIVEILIQHEIGVPLTVMDAAYFVLMLSPSLDPIIYAYYRKDFRHSLYARKRDKVLYNQALSLLGPLKFSNTEAKLRENNEEKNEVETGTGEGGEGKIYLNVEMLNIPTSPSNKTSSTQLS